MEPERFIERMLEIENLTDELEDAQAQRLLDWGMAKVGALVGEIQDADAAGERANALMALMRKVNRLVGRMDGKDAANLAEELGALDDAFTALFSGETAANADERTAAAEALTGASPSDALETILARCPQARPPAPTRAAQPILSEDPVPPAALSQPAPPAAPDEPEPPAEPSPANLWEE